MGQSFLQVSFQQNKEEYVLNSKIILISRKVYIQRTIWWEKCKQVEKTCRGGNHNLENQMGTGCNLPLKKNPCKQPLALRFVHYSHAPRESEPSESRGFLLLQHLNELKALNFN